MTTPASGDDPFAVLGLPREFDLEPAAITRAWLIRSALRHPDRLPGDADAPQEMARLNAARAALSDPERRANVLLAVLGGPASDRDKSLPVGFLEQTLEMREEIEESLAAGRPGDRDRLEAQAIERRREYIARVSGLFGSLGSPPSPEALRAIRMELNAWRYIERLLEQLDPAYNPSLSDFTNS